MLALGIRAERAPSIARTVAWSVTPRQRCSAEMLLIVDASRNQRCARAAAGSRASTDRTSRSALRRCATMRVPSRRDPSRALVRVSGRGFPQPSRDATSARPIAPWRTSFQRVRSAVCGIEQRAICLKFGRRDGPADGAARAALAPHPPCHERKGFRCAHGHCCASWTSRSRDRVVQ